MARLLELRATPTDVVIRPLAITAILYNHTRMFSAGPFGMEGGMATLLMLSGLSFARFAIKNGTVDSVQRSIVHTGRQVFVPSLVLVLLSFAFYREFDVLELLFVRNFRDSQRIAAFYNWYPAMLLQMLAGLYLLLAIPSAGRAMVRRPVRWMLMLFAAGLLLRSLGPLVWDTSYVRHQLPHTMLWNFALGGVVYFLAIDESTSRPATKWLAAACVMAGTAIGHDFGTTRFWWLAASGILLITVKDIRLPNVVARLSMVVSAATFGIILTHEVWFKVASRLNEVWGGKEAVVPANVLLVCALIMGTLSWVAYLALGRAYRALRFEPAPGVHRFGSVTNRIAQ